MAQSSVTTRNVRQDSRHGWFPGLFGGSNVAAGDTPRADAERLGIGEARWTAARGLGGESAELKARLCSDTHKMNRHLWLEL